MRFCTMALLLASFSAMACPNLTGNYNKCVSLHDGSTVSTDLVMSQSVEGGVTTFSSEETEPEYGNRESTKFIADGAERVESDDMDGTTLTTTIIAVCEGDALVINNRLFMDGMPLGNRSTTLSKDGDKLVSVLSQTVMGNEASVTVVCE